MTHKPSYAELYTCLLLHCSKLRVQGLEMVSEIAVSSYSCLEILKCDLPQSKNKQFIQNIAQILQTEEAEYV